MTALVQTSGRHGIRTSAALLAMVITLSAQAADDVRRDVGGASNPRTASQEQPRMWMTVGTQRFAVALEDNPTTRALLQLLPIALDMEELNGNEKHARLPRSLPTRAARPGTIRAGDVLLYGENTLVVFYKTFSSSYSYTRIGRIEESTGLAQALGPGNPRVTLTVP
jgi:hypothetical protein